MRTSSTSPILRSRTWMRPRTDSKFVRSWWSTSRPLSIFTISASTPSSTPTWRKHANFSASSSSSFSKATQALANKNNRKNLQTSRKCSSSADWLSGVKGRGCCLTSSMVRRKISWLAVRSSQCQRSWMKSACSPPSPRRSRASTVWCKGS